MKSIICRESELKTLERIFNSEKSEFIAVYGRRRIGKTYLIRNFFEAKKCIFFNITGTQNGEYKDQLRHFNQRFGETFLKGLTPKLPTNWNDAFKALTELISQTPKNKKVVIFFDELPWLATKKSKLLETLDYYWNQYWSVDNRIKLIVCGSSASWIINKIINNKGGLHNRVTETLFLQPFTLSESARYLALNNKVELPKKQIAEIYMTTGGIPYYLNRVEPGLSATEVIEKLAFRHKAFLLDEFDNLFSSLFEDSDSYIEIIKAIASNRFGIGQTELFKRLTQTSKGSGGLARLKSLEDAGFIMSFKPHFSKERGIYYRVIDEYTLFYLYWIAPLKETKMSHSLTRGYWQALTQTPTWFAWAGYAFEAICYKHLREIRYALDLSPLAIPNSWRHVPRKKIPLESSSDTESNDGPLGAQIDLLFDREDDAMTLCEIKYTKKPFSIDQNYAAVLENKIKVFKQQTRTKKQIFMALISANGVVHNDYLKSLNPRILNLEDLFKTYAF
jgi:AAA+ ATPase superfamily predicted ATPase